MGRSLGGHCGQDRDSPRHGLDFLDAASQMRILLYSFEGVKLEPKNAATVQMPQHSTKPNARRKQTKWNLVNEEYSGREKHMSY